MSKPSPTSQAITTLDHLERDIKIQTQTLEHLKSSNHAQKDAQKQIQAQAQAQSKEIIAKRAEELKALEAGWHERIAPLEKRVLDLKGHLKQQVTQYDEAHSKIIGATAELGKIQDQQATIQSEVNRAQSTVQILETKAAGLQAQIAELSGRIAPLQQEKIEITEEVIKLRKQKEVAQESLEGAEELRGEALIEYERKMHNLKSESEKLSLKIQDDEHQWEVERKDMAARQMKLDKREETLARREQKVSQGERDMARNANLMNL